MESLPTVPKLTKIATLLPLIFPEGVAHRNYLVREMAAKTIFVMFYSGAIQGSDHWIRPDQITKMTDAQSKQLSARSRQTWYRDSLSQGKMKDVPGRWYAANTREPIRDETLRAGLVATGAVVEREGLSTTSAHPRYALEQGFADLFQQKDAKKQAALIQQWQEAHLSSEALARISLLKRGISAAQATGHILAKLPSGETRKLSPGPSSVLTGQVLEQFCPRFLKEPGLIFLTESGVKVIERDEKLAASIGLHIQADRNLPDIILVELATKTPLLIFVEVVVTDGAITPPRKQALLDLAAKAGFRSANIAFVTAFVDRGPVYRRLSSELAWNSFVWFASEPDSIIILKGKETAQAKKLIDLV